MAKRKASRRPAPARKKRIMRVRRRRAAQVKVKVRVPKVGDVVALRWVDSSTAVSRCPETRPKDMKLVTFTLYGKVLHVDKGREQVVIGKEHSDDLDANDEIDQQIVWIPSIERCAVLREDAD